MSAPSALPCNTPSSMWAQHSCLAAQAHLWVKAEVQAVQAAQPCQRGRQLQQSDAAQLHGQALQAVVRARRLRLRWEQGGSLSGCMPAQLRTPAFAP